MFTTVRSTLWLLGAALILFCYSSQPVGGVEHSERQTAESHLELAKDYFNGRGVTKDYSKAAFHFRLAAEQGHVKALHLTAISFNFGFGVAEDYAEAVRWYRKAAAQSGQPDPLACWMPNCRTHPAGPSPYSPKTRLA